MAKELPYFKFEPNQWENGNIQMLSREDKGLFIDLCSIYWSRLGDLPYKLVLQKLCAGNATALKSLCDENIIEVINENIYIKFLSEQLNEFEDIKKQNSKNAKEGWEKRRKLKEKCENDATASKSQCESDAIREEKIREEKIKEEEIKKNNDGKNFFPKNFDDDFQKFKILFYKNLTDDFDFTFEIQKIKNQLDQEKPEQEKTFLSQQLNFLISEKIKKVAPKKEINHEAFLETLLTSVENTSWRETIFMQHRINEIELKQKFKEFNVMLSSKKRNHKSEREYVDHFTNWLTTQKSSQPKKVSEFNHNR